MTTNPTTQPAAPLEQCQLELRGALEELQQTNAALRESEEKFKGFFEHSYCGMAITQLTGVMQVNPAFCQLLGYTPEEMKGRSWQAISHPDDVARASQLLAELFAGKQDSCRFTKRYLHRNGSEIWADVSTTLRRDETGHPLYFVTTLSDITEREQIETIQRFLAQTSSGLPGEPFFSSLARFLAEILAMDFICIDRLEGDGLTARTEAVWCDGKFEDNVSYALRDTPCGDVVGKQICCFPSKVCQFFPNDQVLQDLRAESYAGTTLFDHTGKPNGLIAVISRKPLANRPLVEATLQMVAVRAAGELERMQAEENLREREMMLRESQRIAGLGSYVLDISSGHWSSSDVLDELFGIDAAHDRSVAGWAALMHPDDRAMMVDHFTREVLGQGEPFNKEYRIIRPSDQEERWVHGLGKLELDAQGHPQRMLGTIQDITAQKQAAEALRISQARFRSIVESSPMGMHLYELMSDGRLVFSGANRAADRILRVDNTQFIGKTIEEAFPGLVNTEIPSRYRDAALHGTTWQTEEIVYHEGMISGAYEIAAFQTEPAKMAVSFYDISARKRTEAELRESEHKYAKMLANIGDVIVIIDPAGINRYKSPNLERLFGWQPEEVVGHNTFENVHADDVEPAREFIGTLLSEPNATGTTQCRYQCKDGSYKWIEFTAVNLQHDPTIRGILGNYHDVTERMQAEAALKAHSEELARFNRCATDRELRMIELKREMNELLRQVGQPPRFPLNFDQAAAAAASPEPQGSASNHCTQ